MATELWAIALVLAGSLLGALGSLLFKKGSKNISRNILKSVKNKMIIVGFIIYGISIIPYIIALRGGELSVLYPLVSTTYVWSALLAVHYLKEKMNKFKWMGIFLIITGVMFIGIGS